MSLTPDDLSAARAAQIDTMTSTVELCTVAVTRDRYATESLSVTVVATSPARIGLSGGSGGGSMRDLVEALRNQGKLRVQTRILTLPYGTTLTTQYSIRHDGVLWDVVALADDHTHATALRAVITRDEVTPQ